MEGMGGNNYLSAEILMDFTKSIENVDKYAKALAGLNADLGSLESRLTAMKDHINSTAGTNSQSNLKANIESQIKRAIMENGVVIESVGQQPFTIKKEVVKTINQKIDAQINAILAQQAENIQVKLDPAHKGPSTAKLSDDQFKEFNDQVAKMVRNQMHAFNQELKKLGVSGLTAEDLQGISLDVGKGTVKTIITEVKRKIKPILDNPVVDTEGIQLKVNARETQKIARIVSKSIAEKLASGTYSGVELDSSAFQAINNSIASIVNRQISTLNKNLAKMDLGTLNKPIQDLNQRTRNLIAEQIGMSREELDRSNFRMTGNQVNTVHIQESFNKLGATFNRKVSQMSTELTKEINEQIKSVNFEIMPSIQYELNDHLKSINNALMRKIRQQIDLQMRHIQQEIENAGVAPSDLHRTNAIRSFGSGGAAPTARASRGVVNNNTTIINNNAPASQRTQLSPMDYRDPYARRDSHFASMGFENAMINTLRHIVAGGMVGAPIMAVYEAISTFKETQLEYLKIFQNLSLKEDYKGEDGKPDYGLAQAEVEKLIPDVKSMSNFYAIEYNTMSQVAAVASRLTRDAAEAKQFMDYSSMIYRLDNEGDIVNEIAPGLEALMGQFGKSVWEMDEAVKAFAYATNVTKATTSELMAGLSRSGSTFNAANIDMTTATMMMASALQATGLSGADVGNMFKTLNTRMGMPSVRKKLEEDFGIEIYEEDANGRTVRRDGAEILAEVANLIASKPTGIGDDDLDKLLNSLAGGYQIGKVRAFIESMNTIGSPVVNPETGQTYDPINVLKMAEEARQQEMEQVLSLVRHSLDNPAISMDRAGVAITVALTSILEEMAPTIENLASTIVNVSGFIQRNSEAIGELITVLLNAAVGFAAVQGVKWAGGKAGYQTHRENAGIMNNLYGTPTTFGRGGTDPRIDRIAGILGDDLDMLSQRGRRSFDFVTMSMASSTLAPFVKELSDMDEQRAKQIMAYNDDRRGGAQVTSMGDLANLLNESRDYNDGKMSADEERARANQNVRALSDRQELRFMFSQAMQDAIQYIDTDLDTGDNKEKVNRTMGTMSRMDLGDFDSFARFLEEDGQRNNTRIRNIQDLTMAYDRYATTQRTVLDLQRAQDPHLEAINNRYADITNELNRTSSNRSFNDFLNTSRRNVTALSNSLLSLGRTLGSLGAQMALFTAIGDIISGNVSYGAMTDTQRIESDVRRENEHNQKYLEYQDTMFSKDSSILDKVLTFLEPGTAGVYNGIVDLFTKGDAKTDITDFFKSMFASKEALRELYGTDDLEKIKEETGKTTKEIANEVNKKLGLVDKLNEAEEKAFYEEYNDFRNAQELQDKRRQQAIDDRNAYTKGLLSKGESGYSAGAVIEAIDADVKAAKEESSMNEIKALLNGVKTNTQEYYKLLIDNLQNEIDTYDEYLSDLDKTIAGLEQELAGTEKTGEDGKITEEYKAIEQELKDVRSVRDDVAKETDKARLQAQLEQKKMRFDAFMTGFNERASIASFNRYMDDYYRDMTTVSGSAQDSQLAREANQKERQEIESRIAELQANQGDDINGVIGEQLREWQKRLADNVREMSQLLISSLGVYQDRVDRVTSSTELRMLQAQVSSGITDASDPALKGIRLSLLNERNNTIQAQIAALQADLANVGNADPDYKDSIEKQIMEYQKQSLQIQLEQLQEMKASRGTFNLPDGVRVMSQLDYVMGQGTHSQFSVQSGDAYVNVILPNVTGNTSQAALQNIGSNLGKSINDGRINSMRGQLSANPTGYRVLT